MTQTNRNLSNIILGLSFVTIALVIFGWLDVAFGHAEPTYAPSESFCIVGTYLQADGTCLPKDATR